MSWRPFTLALCRQNLRDDLSIKEVNNVKTYYTGYINDTMAKLCYCVGKHQVLCNNISKQMLVKMDDNSDFLWTICFCDEFDISCHERISRLNCHIWAYGNPHVVFDHEWHSPKINVWCHLLHNKVIRPFIL